MNENVFRHFKTQTCAYSEYGVYNIAGTSNRFEDMLFWDWNTATVNPNGVYIYNISTKAYNTVIRDHAVASISKILDAGWGTDIKCADRQLYHTADYDYFVIKVGSTYYARIGQYGDMPVSGSYDRTTDFQALMVLILAHDDIKVKLGEGIFEPDSKINVGGKNITLEGMGDHRTIIKCANGTQYASGLLAAVDIGDDNLTIRNIVFSGDGASDTSIGIYFGNNEDISGLDIQNCKFSNWVAGTSKAIYSKPGTNDNVYFISIINSNFFNCNYGIFLNGDPDSSINWSIISGNEFDQCDYSIACDYTNFTIITNNIIRNGGTVGIALQGKSCNNTINSNIIKATTGITGTADCYNNTIMMNNVMLCTNDIDSFLDAHGNHVMYNMGKDI